MSCALLVCTPSPHASVLAAQALLPRRRGGIAARSGSSAGSSCPLQCGTASRHRSDAMRSRPLRGGRARMP